MNWCLPYESEPHIKANGGRVRTFEMTKHLSLLRYGAAGVEEENTMDLVRLDTIRLDFC